MIAALMMSANLVTLSILKIKIFWNLDYDVLISLYDVTNKILLRDSSCIIDVAMWPKFGNFNISMTEVIITSILEGFDQKKKHFLRVALGSSSIISDWHQVWPWTFTPVWQKGWN